MSGHQRLQKDFTSAELAEERGLGALTKPSGGVVRPTHSYSIHNLVTHLQERVPPRTRPIDISDRHWMRQVWKDVFTQLIGLRDEDPDFAKLLRQVCAVVINYDSSSVAGIYGGRHTAALLNLDRLTGRPRRQVQGLSGLTRQNHVFCYGDEARFAHAPRKASPAKMIEAFWRDNWLRYMLLDTGPDDRRDRDPATFTINNMLLRRAVYPRPVLITWDASSPDVASRASTLAPLTLHVPESVRADDLSGPSLDEFLSAFRKMFDQSSGTCRDRSGHDWTIDAESITRMVSALLRHFGSIGGNAFFTIPVMLLVEPARGRASGTHAELRAAISVLLKLPQNDFDLAAAGWFFFDSFANRILTSILASEFVAVADSRWEGVRADSAHLASHPIKNKSRPALAAQKALQSALDQVGKIMEPILGPATVDDGVAVGTNPDELLMIAIKRADLERLRTRLGQAREFCAKAMTNVQILDGIVNLMSLLLDFGPELQEAIVAGIASPTRGAGKVDLLRELTSAALEVADKKLGTHSVRLESDKKSALVIPRRFGSHSLKKYRELENILYRAIFSELLQNAANYGVDPLDPRSRVIPVTIEAGSPIRIRNYVHPKAERDLADKARQVSSDAPLDRMSSGLYFVKRAFSELAIGDIYARVFQERVEGSPIDREYFVWEFLIYIKGL